jgi:hypothetical protein
VPLIDAYATQARVAPVVLALLPLLAAAGVVTSSLSLSWQKWPVAGLFATALTTLAAEVGRDRGKRLEGDLWRRWGGAPTTAGLRWAGNPYAVVAHRHVVVQKALGKEADLPTEAEEKKDPAAADMRYELAVHRLRMRTRDAKRFPLLKRENTSYGFRRNLFGLRGVGISSACIAVAMTAGVFGTALGIGRLGSVSLSWSAPGVTGVVALFLWSRLKDVWLEDVARSYADQLFEAAEILATSKRK